MDDPSRRAMMAAIAAFPMAEAADAANIADANAAKSRTLVAYFSRSGNTRVIAGVIQRAQHADLFEIRPARAYPEDYFETVEQARQERDRDARPALANPVVNVVSYDTVFLGFPIWGETLPSVIRTLLATHDLAGKVVIPFITHGGYGPGDAAAQLVKRAAGAKVQAAFVMEADQERRTTTQVQAWLGKLK